MSNSPLRTTLIALFFVLMFVCSISSAILLLGTSYTSSFSGFVYQLKDDRIEVVRVEAPELAGLLRAGDQIVEFNGKPVTGSVLLHDFFVLADAGTPYEVVVLRDGQRQKFTLETIPTTSGMRVGVFASTVLIPLFFQLTGLLIFLLKRNDKQALLIALTFGMMGVSATAASLPITPFWIKVVLLIGATINAFLPATGFHFALIFPEVSRFVKKYPRLPILSYLPVVLIALPVRTYGHYLFITNPELGASFFRTSRFNVLGLILLLYVGASLVVLVLNYRDANQVARRKLRVLLAGWLAGSLPVLLITLAFILQIPLFGPTAVAVGLVAAFATLLLPIAFAYAVLRHQVIPVTILIRRSVQYLLAKNALRVLLVLPLIGILVSILANPDRSIAEIFLRNSLYFYLLIFTAISLLSHRDATYRWLIKAILRWTRSTSS